MTPQGKMKKAVFLYNFTPLALNDWLADGWTCFSVDAQHPAGVSIDPVNPGLIRVGMFLERDEATIQKLFAICGDDVQFVGGFPPCDDLANSGSRWFAKKLEADPLCQIRAAGRAMLVEDVALRWGCPWFAENPVGRLSTLWRPANFYFEPWEYGGYLPLNDTHPLYPGYIKPRDAYPKKTGIWCGNGFITPERKPVNVLAGYSAQYKKLGGKSAKTKEIRSATPRGFARAVKVFNANRNV